MPVSAAIPTSQSGQALRLASSCSILLRQSPGPAAVMAPASAENDLHRYRLCGVDLYGRLSSTGGRRGVEGGCAGGRFRACAAARTTPAIAPGPLPLIRGQRLEHALLGAAGPALGCAALGVNHRQAQQAEQAAGDTGSQPHRRALGDQQHHRSGEPRQDADADHWPWIGEAAGQRRRNGWHNVHATGQRGADQTTSARAVGDSDDPA